MPERSQTISYLGRRFAEVGIRLRSRHGQNFLIDLNLLRLLVERAEIEPRDVVLEVGTGTGAVTALVAQSAAAVVSVEIDPQLHQLAKEELFGLENVLLLQQDALATKSTLEPRVVAAVQERLAQGADRRLKLVANLPYSVATPVIANLLGSPIVPYSLTATIQKELAERIVAAPGTKSYGALSVWIQSQCHVELVRVLPPSVFWPRPKVSSAIVHITVDSRLRGRIDDLDAFHGVVRTLFLYRRKLLRGAIESGWKGRLEKSRIDQILAELDIRSDLRAEQLDVATLIALAGAITVACRRVETKTRLTGPGDFNASTLGL